MLKRARKVFNKVNRIQSKLKKPTKRDSPTVEIRKKNRGWRVAKTSK
jgi:hypothetical protein